MPQAKPTPVADLGDAAWTFVSYREALGQYQASDATVRVRKGSTGLEISLSISDQDDPDNVDFGPGLRLSESAIGRISDPVEVVAEAATGACRKLDLAAASAAYGIELTGSRSHTLDETTTCALAGRKGMLWIHAEQGDDAVERFRRNSGAGLPISGLGDQAYGTPKSKYILTGDRMLTVSLAPDDGEAYARESGRSGIELMTPTKQQLAFLKSVVSSFS
ncbi:hypothetical protein [Flindersiella endophytica]